MRMRVTRRVAKRESLLREIPGLESEWWRKWPDCAAIGHPVEIPSFGRLLGCCVCDSGCAKIFRSKKLYSSCTWLGSLRTKLPQASRGVIRIAGDQNKWPLNRRTQRNVAGRESGIEDRNQRTVRNRSVVMLGSWPPCPGISAYCFELAHAVGKRRPLRYLAFRHMYPSFLYPGGDLSRDDTFPETDTDAIDIQQTLDWYNPFGWIFTGLRTPGDVLHVQFWSLPLVPVFATIMALWRLRGKAALLTIHNLAEHESRPLYRLGMRLLTYLASGVVLHVAEVPSWLAEHCRRNRKPIWTIAHGTLDLYRDETVDACEARRRLGIPEEAAVALFFGAIRPYKGLDLLLEAFGQVLHQVPQAWLIVAGRPWEDWQRYQKMIDDLGIGERVTLSLGYIPTSEVKWLFAACDLVVLPYRDFSAQSGVGLAGLAFERPLLVTDTGALRELQPDPNLVVPAGVVGPLATALSRLLADRETLRSLRSAAAASAARFSWDQIAQETLAAYDQLAPPTTICSPLLPEEKLIAAQGDQVDSPMVSYIVITMNRQQEVGICLRNLLDQEYPHKEVILVDNCSTDGTVAWVRETFPEVKVVALASNEGVAGGRNRGAEAARGSLLLFIDDDAEFVSPEATWQMVRYFAKDPGLACVGFCILDSSTEEQERKSIPRLDKKILAEDYAATYFCGAGFGFRRQAFLELGMFWEPLVYGGQELDLSYRALDHGYGILQSQQIKVLHKSVKTARPPGQWVYFNARDRWWIAVRNLPWRYVVSTAAMWWFYTAWLGMRRRQLGYFFRGFFAGLSGFPRALKGRRKVRPETLRQVSELAGRVYY